MKAFTKAYRLISLSGAVLTAGAVTTGVSLPQRPDGPINPGVLLEVIATHTTPAHEDRFVYLRVFSDGTAECQSSKPGDPENKERGTIKKTLTKEEFSRIKSLVEEPELADVGARYETRYAIVDSWTEWRINIRRKRQVQNIEIMEFSPGLAKTMKHPYPQALVKLGCTLEKMRAYVSGEASLLDSECRNVLDQKPD